MQNCRLNMRGDERFDLHIRTDGQGYLTQAYANTYFFHQSICTQQGCRALILTPGAQDTQSNSIMCLAGIACTPDGMRHAGEGRGFQTAYAQARHALKNALDVLLTREGDITIVGHSLGGTVAMLFVAQLPHAVQARLRLITFGAPKVTSAIAHNIHLGHMHDSLGQSRSVRVWAHGDPLANFGKQAPAGSLTLEVGASKDGFEAQRAALLSDAQIDGVPVDMHWGAPLPRGSRVLQNIMRSSYHLLSCLTPA